MTDINASSGHPAPTYYNEYQEKQAPSMAKLASQGNGDGYTMYRALARHIIGDPAKYNEIRDVVLRFAISVRSNFQHPLHKEYLNHETTHRGIGNEHRELFSILDCPDLLVPNEHMCWVITRALKIEIHIYESITNEGVAKQLTLSSGPAKSIASYALLKTPLKSKILAVRYSALLPDESGKAIIEFCQTTKKHMESQANVPASKQDSAGLRLKQISWAWNKAYYMNVTCFNEFREGSKPKDLKPEDNMSRMDTFVAVVDEPQQVKPALKILRKIVELAPNQQKDAKVSSSCSPGRVLPHCSADGEFVKLPRDLVKDRDRATVNGMIADGEVEELCSILTIAVGSHFSLVVNVVHMLENANEHTVPALEQLFRETIFNSDLLKLWWNLQQDFFVLDNTIAHMYQGTAREKFYYEPHRSQGLLARYITPVFRITSKYLDGKRPDDMEFPRGNRACEIHSSGTNERDMSCPCQLGNVDIAALLAHFCRQQGFGFGTSMLSWNNHRDHFNYGHLIKLMLMRHRLLPLLQHMKDEANTSGVSRDGFYQSLGEPDMVFNDGAMGYVTMDVYGLNIIFEQLFARDDPEFVAAQLHSYGYKHVPLNFLIKDSTPLKQRLSSLKSVGGIPLFEDNPKRFIRESFWEDYTDEESMNRQRKLAPELLATATLTPWQHDERVNLTKAIAKKRKISRLDTQNAVFATPAFAERWDANRTREGIMIDPSKLWLPNTCARIIDAEYPDPIVRSGTAHSEALIEFLKSSHCKNASPPPGFGAAPGTQEGLPPPLDRAPGHDLNIARNIFEAFPRKTGSGERLGELEVVPSPVVIDEHEPEYKDLVEKAMKEPEWRSENVWDQARLVRDQLLRGVEKQKRKNETEGLPTTVDMTDVFDIEGREYRRRVEATPKWNRPELPSFPALHADGSWKSQETEMLKALPKELEEDGDDWTEVDGSRKRKRRWHW